ncbi:MFS transporter [Pyramidobacter piscolens]|uniref:MFS transporter n=1 Tax=Pyramidobacter piscolens TaxID=638849 RepID=UPI001FCC9603|nr:MFS transporter [Pyramidobacter piscolens]BDF78155.1 MFS transporter [Pyramidobacter piscolens]
MFANRSVFAWCLYDTGHCAFATVVMAVVLPVYYQNVVAGGGSWALSSWGYASSVALLLSALLTPVVGTYVDGRPLKKKFLLAFAAFGILASAALALSGRGTWLYTLSCMVLGTVGLSVASVCYDALLTFVAPPGTMDRVSTLGYGVGYLGGGALLALDMVLIARFGEPGVKMSFLSVALWWSAAAAALTAWVPEPPAAGNAPSGLRQTLRALAHSWTELKQYPEALRFMVSFWLYNDGIGTIVRMAAVFGAGLGISQNHLVGAMLATQFVGVPFALVFARLAEKSGSKRAVMIALFWYTTVAVGAMFITQNWHFWLMAVAVGMVQGGSQAISRSIYASMLPAGRSGHFFGLYNVSSKFAGIVGPALCGFVAQATGSLRLAVGVIALNFIGGMLILAGVDVDKGRARVAER